MRKVCGGRSKTSRNCNWHIMSSNHVVIFSIERFHDFHLNLKGNLKFQIIFPILNFLYDGVLKYINIFQLWDCRIFYTIGYNIDVSSIGFSTHSKSWRITKFIFALTISKFFFYCFSTISSVRSGRVAVAKRFSICGCVDMDGLGAFSHNTLLTLQHHLSGFEIGKAWRRHRHQRILFCSSLHSTEFWGCNYTQLHSTSNVSHTIS